MEIQEAISKVRKELICGILEICDEMTNRNSDDNKQIFDVITIVRNIKTKSVVEKGISDVMKARSKAIDDIMKVGHEANDGITAMFVNCINNGIGIDIASVTEMSKSAILTAKGIDTTASEDIKEILRGLVF